MGANAPAHFALTPLTLAALLAIQTALTGACAGPAASQGSGSVRGVIMEVTPRTFNELESIQLRTEAGAVMVFLVEPDAGLTAGHAREHMVLVEPVTVFYRSAADGLRAHTITD